VSLRRAAATIGPVVVTAAIIAWAPTPASAPEGKPAPSVGALAAVADEQDGPRAVAAVAPDPTSPPVTGAPPAQSLAVTDLAVLAVDRSGVPARAMQAYRAAVKLAAPCHVRWELLAGIGRVESDHGRYAGSVVQPDGKVAPAILGPRLDGSGPFALIRDSDGGRFDGDPDVDRAVGPMQFLPSTWLQWGADADGDGVADPQDVDDAALGTARYLCASGGRVDTARGMIAAVYSYNHSYDYVRAVLTVAAEYAGVAPATFGTDLLPAPTPDPAASPSASPSPSPTVAAAPAAAPPAAPAPAPAPAPAAQPASSPARTSPTATTSPSPTTAPTELAPLPTAEATSSPTPDPDPSVAGTPGP
jgi:hypothetical protein